MPNSHSHSHGHGHGHDHDPFELNEPIDPKDQGTLEAKLHSYQRALESEFTDGVKYEEGKLTPLEIRDKTKELLTQAVPKAVARLIYIVEHSPNEAVQFKAATFIIDKAVGKEIGNLVGDPLEALLGSLHATTPKAT